MNRTYILYLLYDSKLNKTTESRTEDTWISIVQGSSHYLENALLGRREHKIYMSKRFNQEKYINLIREAKIRLHFENSNKDIEFI